MTKEPLVSVLCETYNHEDFIKEAIEGFLMQQTTFPFEILMHDDASTDNTPKIIREYERNYPELIFPIYQKENQFSKGKKPRIAFQIPRARGKYIALCEGDDYWTDPLKLQKQVEFLEENEEYVMCFHRCYFLSKDSDGKIIKNAQDIKHIKYEYNMFGILYYWNIPTASIVFRNVFLFKKSKVPEYFSDVKSGDIALASFLYQFGKFYLFEEIMSVYRRFGLGVSMTHKGFRMAHYRAKLYYEINEYYNYQYEEEIYKALYSVMKRYAPEIDDHFGKPKACKGLPTKELVRLLINRFIIWAKRIIRS